MKHDFSLAKSRIGIYFNTGDFSYSVQMPPSCKPDKQLVKAIKAAYCAFNAAYNPKTGRPTKRSRRTK